MPIDAQTQAALAAAVANMPKLGQGNWDKWYMSLMTQAELFEVEHALVPLQPLDGQQLPNVSDEEATKAKYLLANSMETTGRLRIVHDAATPRDALRELRSMHDNYVEAHSSLLVGDVTSLCIEAGEPVGKYIERGKELFVKARQIGQAFTELAQANLLLQGVERHPELADVGTQLRRANVPLTVAKVAAELLRAEATALKEKQRKAAARGDVPAPPARDAPADGAVMRANAAQGQRRGRGGRGGRGRGRGRGGHQQRGQGATRGRGRGAGRSSRDYVTCYNCGEVGHFRDECDRPPKRQRGEDGRARGTSYRAVMEPDRADDLPADMPPITTRPFHPPSGAGSGPSSSNPRRGSSYWTRGATYMTGKTPERYGEWIVDGGASHHMTPCRAMLTNYEAMEGEVSVGDGEVLRAVGRGTVCVEAKVGDLVRRFHIKDVWYVPGLVPSLLSTHQLYQYGCWYTGVNGVLTYFNNRNEPMFTARSHEGAYRINWDVYGNPTQPMTAYVTQETAELWHHRMGHVGYDALQHMVEHGLLSGINVPASEFRKRKREVCDVCVQAKHARAPFQRSDVRATEPLERVHTDLCGPYEERSLRGHRYALTLKDDCTNLLGVVTLAHKSDVRTALPKLLAEWAGKLNRKVRKVRSDRGGEYMDEQLQDWFAANGIEHEPTAPYTPQHNGRAEVANRNLNDRVRAMLFHFGLPKSYWADAIEYAAHLCNVKVVRRLGVTPYQAFYGVAPDVSGLRTFGCKVFARVPDQLRRKLDPKSQIGVYMGPVPGGQCRVLVSAPAGKLQYRVCRLKDVLTLEDVSACADLQTPSESRGGRDELPVSLDYVPRGEQEHVPHNPAVPSAPPRAATPERGGAPSATGVGDGAPRAATVGVSAQDAAHVGTGAQQQLQQQPQQLQSADTVGDRAQQHGVHTQQHAAHDAARGGAPGQGGGGAPGLATGGNSAPFVPSGDVRRSTRVRTEPVRFASDPWYMEIRKGTASAQFVTSRKGTVYVVLSVTKHDVPQSFADAVSGKFAEEWISALVSEINSLLANHTWRLVPRKPGMKVIPSKWVFKIKCDADGRPYRFKCRLVAGGHRQVWGVDYQLTFAPVTRVTSERIFLSVAAARGWKVHQIDISTAFLHGDIDTDVYMEQPEGFVQGSNMVCKLQKCIYGLKQAPRAWHAKLTACLRGMGFVNNVADPCVWVLVRSGSARVYLCMVVDDMLVTSPDERATLRVIRFILLEFKGVHTTTAVQFDGKKLTWLPHERAVLLTQTAHIEDLLEKYGMADCNPVSLPIQPGMKLRKGGHPLDVARFPYASLVGSLLYLAVSTRPDIAQLVTKLARYMASPTLEHWKAARYLLRYLKGTKHWGIRLGGGNGVYGYCDADWASCEDTRRSTTGFCFSVLGGTVSWQSKMQPTVATSTTEAEYQACAHATREALWIRQVLQAFDVPCTPMLLYGDSQGAIQAIQNDTVTPRTKHIDVMHHFVRERVRSGEIQLVQVPGAENTADVLTKAVVRVKHEWCMRSMGMMPAPV